MKILSLNVNGATEDSTNNLMKQNKASIYCFQESKYGIRGNEKINTVNYYKEVLEKENEKLSSIWNELFPWLEFPENYFAENIIKDEEGECAPFVLINVHLAGFYSGKRYPIMLTLLKRLQMEDLEGKNVILLGDFNAQKTSDNASKLARQGSEYIKLIENNRFVEILKDEKKEPIETYYDSKNNAFRYDHIFFRKGSTNNFNVLIKKYLPEVNEDKNKWISDHRGIMIEVTGGVIEDTYNDI